MNGGLHKTTDDRDIVVCTKSDLREDAGVAAIVDGKQIAIFYLPDTERTIYALGNYDPIGGANVLSRGIVGDIGGTPVVASPLYKQHFCLATGRCLEHTDARVTSYPIRLDGDRVVLSVR